MTVSGCGRAAEVSLLALLLVALGSGVPVHGEAEHDGEGAHFGAAEHAHGLALVRNDMRAERASPPVFVSGERAPTEVPAPEPRTFAGGPRDETIPESRAPPTSLPRAPPS